MPANGLTSTPCICLKNNCPSRGVCLRIYIYVFSLHALISAAIIPSNALRPHIGRAYPASPANALPTPTEQVTPGPCHRTRREEAAAVMSGFTPGRYRTPRRRSRGRAFVPQLVVIPGCPLAAHPRKYLSRTVSLYSGHLPKLPVWGKPRSHRSNETPSSHHLTSLPMRGFRRELDRVVKERRMTGRTSP